MPDARIVAIGTAVPPTVVLQAAARDVLLAQSGLTRVAERLIGAAAFGPGVTVESALMTVDGGEP